MKTAALIIIVCLVLLLGGISSNQYINSSADRLYGQLQTIEKSIEVNQWPDAEKQVKTAIDTWNNSKEMWSILLNHQEIDNIDISISRLEKYVQEKAATLSLGEISALKLLVEHISDTEAFNIKNIL